MPVRELEMRAKKRIEFGDLLINFAMRLSGSSAQVNFRCVATKLYYAMFHQAGSILDDCGIVDWDVASGHWFLAQKFTNVPDDSDDSRVQELVKSLKQVGTDLRDLKGYRVKADYRPWESFQVSGMQHALDKTVELHGILRSLRTTDGSVDLQVKSLLTRSKVDRTLPS